MEKVTEERVCKNCKYYVEHYVIILTRFHPIGGHCINNALYNPHKKNTWKLHDNCAYWEINDGVKAERHNSIKEALRAIEKHLYYIKEILSNDE